MTVKSALKNGALLQVDTRCKQHQNQNLTHSNPNPSPIPIPNPNPSPNLTLSLSPTVVLFLIPIGYPLVKDDLTVYLYDGDL